MIIRKATHDDVDMVVDMGRDFHAYSPWSHIEFDREATKEFIGKVIEGGVVFLSDSGMIGGVLNPLYFNPSHVVAAELFWWAKSGGIPLMRAFEEWAKENNARGLQFSGLGDAKSERMDRLFTRSGYRKVETGYFKDVC